MDKVPNLISENTYYPLLVKIFIIFYIILYNLYIKVQKKCTFANNCPLEACAQPDVFSVSKRDLNDGTLLEQVKTMVLAY